MKPHPLPTGLIFGPIVVACLWGAHSCGGVRYFKTSWNTAPGTVVSVTAVPDESGLTSRIQYTFAVDGKEYHSDRLKADGSGFASVDEASEAVRRYREGQEVQVYYKPDRPEESALELIPVDGTLGGILLLVAAFHALGWLAILADWARRRRSGETREDPAL